MQPAPEADIRARNELPTGQTMVPFEPANFSPLVCPPLVNLRSRSICAHAALVRHIDVRGPDVRVG
jgi:hypothetical protein